MNCQKGDVAMVVRVFDRKNNWMLGMVVRCKELVRLNGWDFWMLEQPMSPPTGIFDYEACADRCLKPLRDPGGDAVDEVLLRMPSPALAVGFQ